MNTGIGGSTRSKKKRKAKADTSTEEQSVLVSTGAEPVTDHRATNEKDEKVAVILRLSKLIAENLIEKNPSIEALTRVIDTRMSTIIFYVNDIVSEEEPRNPKDGDLIPE